MEKEVLNAFAELELVCLKQAAHNKDAQKAIQASFVIARHFYDNLIWFFRKN